jgi:hypothetical protein
MKTEPFDFEKSKMLLPLVYGFIKDCHAADIGVKELFLAFMFCLEEFYPSVLKEVDEDFGGNRGTLQ